MIREATFYLTPPMAAEHLSLSASTLAKLRVRGGGPLFMRLGRRIVYRPADLDAWAESHRFRSTSEYVDVAVR